MNDIAEYIDIYDEARRRTGEVLPRGTFLQPGQFQIYALAVVQDTAGRFLITERAKDKEWGGGMWEIPGGGVPAGETSAETIVREVFEETGLRAGDAAPELLYTYVNIDPTLGHNYFTDIWRLVLDFTAEDVVIAPREADSFRLVSWEDIVALGEGGQFLHYERLCEALQK